jgi:hypothetical protein
MSQCCPTTLLGGPPLIKYNYDDIDNNFTTRIVIIEIMTMITMTNIGQY